MKIKIKGILSVIGAWIHQFILFPSFVISNMVPYLISHLHNTKDSSLTQNDGFFFSPITNMEMSICCFLSGIFEKNFGLYPTIILGGILISLGSFLLSICKYFYIDFIITILYGLGFGICFMCAVKNACKYFPERQGLISAICGGIGGNMGSAFCNLLLKLIINPKNKDPDENSGIYEENIAKNIKKYLLTYMYMVLIGTFLSILFIKKFKEEKKEIIEKEKILYLEENKDNEENNNTTNTIKELIDESKKTENNENIKKEEIKLDELTKNDYCFELKTLLKNCRIYYILFIYFFATFSQSFLMTTAFVFGVYEKKICDSDFMSYTFFTMSLTGCIAGPIWGFLYDKIGFKISLSLINILTMSNILSLLFTVKIKWLYAFNVVFNGNLNTGAFSFMFPRISKVFGFKFASEIYGIIVLSIGFSSLIGSITFYFIQESSFDYINPYYLVFFIGSFFNLISTLMCIFESNKTNIN